MDEFLRILRMLAEFPPAITMPLEFPPVTNAYYRRWQWYFRGRPASDWMTGADLSRFYDDDASLLSHRRYRHVVGCHQRLSRRLIAVVGRVADG